MQEAPQKKEKEKKIYVEMGAGYVDEAEPELIIPEPLPERDLFFADIAYRRGIGNDLAEGIRYVSRKYNFKMPKSKKSASSALRRK